MTFSIVAFDKEKSKFGIATCSAIPCIGEYFAFGDGSAGVIAAQGSCNPYNGLRGIEMLKNKLHPKEVLSKLRDLDKNIEKRQIAIISSDFKMAGFTGSNLGNGLKKQIFGENYIISGNTLVDEDCIELMRNALIDTNDEIEIKLLNALSAVPINSGDLRGRQSAALHVYSTQNDYPIVKINVDDCDTGIDPVHLLNKYTNRYLKSFYKLFPYFPQKNGIQKDPKDDPNIQIIFQQFKKEICNREFI
jgi:uncharacterized Ntn-hydrolase superfamily protein